MGQKSAGGFSVYHFHCYDYRHFNCLRSDQISANADLGFTKENVMLVPVNNTHISRNFKTFKEELKHCPDVVSVTATDDIFGVSHNTHEFRPEGMAEESGVSFRHWLCNWDFN